MMSASNYQFDNDNGITLQQQLSVLDLSPLPKPKRPLSGYNLYYRYKRIKILEATSHFNDDETTSINDDSKAIVIKNIIMCLPGLESIPRHDTMYLPKESIDELRASKIRLVMSDKLLPNENTRSRLHRKLHGMGFVEMGTIMREVSCFWLCYWGWGWRYILYVLLSCAYLNEHMMHTFLYSLIPNHYFP